MCKRDVLIEFHGNESTYHTTITNCKFITPKAGITGGIDFYENRVVINNMTLIPGNPTAFDFLKMAWSAWKHRKYAPKPPPHYCPSC